MPSQPTPNSPSGAHTQTITEELKEAYPPAHTSPTTLITNPTQTTTTETPLRLLGYAARLRTLAIAGARYLAYTSDVGEAFRPVVPPRIVTAAYAISFGYVGFDVAFEGYKKSLQTDDKMIIARTVAERVTFQGLASLLLPALTIHTVVDLTGKALRGRPKTAFVRWTPTLAGLLVVPFLPVMYDHPLETFIEKTFDRVWPVEDKHEKKE